MCFHSFLYFFSSARGNQLHERRLPTCFRLVFFKNRTNAKHVNHVSNTADIPSRDIPIKDCSTEHEIHVSDTTDIPSRDISIEGCLSEHESHISNIADIPSRDIPIKGGLVEHGFHSIDIAYISHTNIIIELTLSTK